MPKNNTNIIREGIKKAFIFIIPFNPFKKVKNDIIAIIELPIIFETENSCKKNVEKPSYHYIK